MIRAHSGAPAAIHARAVATIASSISTGALRGMWATTLPASSTGSHSESTRISQLPSGSPGAIKGSAVSACTA